jgi:hypothetical protein
MNELLIASMLYNSILRGDLESSTFTNEDGQNIGLLWPGEYKHESYVRPVYSESNAKVSHFLDRLRKEFNLDGRLTANELLKSMSGRSNDSFGYCQHDSDCIDALWPGAYTLEPLGLIATCRSRLGETPATVGQFRIKIELEYGLTE